MNWRPAETIAPHSGQGGVAPSPRNPSPAAVSITPAIFNVMRTMTEGRHMGRMWRAIIRADEAPWRRTAAMKSACRRLKASARASLAMGGHAVSEIAMMALVIPGPRAAAKPSARMRPGNDRKMSVTRMRISSTAPPR